MKGERLLKLIVAPRISEKTTRVAEAHKQFVFRVTKDANKPGIKQAVELMFNVKVRSVQVCNIKGKAKSFRRVRGRRPDQKKAYVSLMPGYDIDYMGSE